MNKFVIRFKNGSVEEVISSAAAVQFWNLLGRAQGKFIRVDGVDGQTSLIIAIDDVSYVTVTKHEI